jgi:hypothetical protein
MSCSNAPLLYFALGKIGSRRTGEQETAVERCVFSSDLLLYRSTALFLLRKNRGDKTPVELFVAGCEEIGRQPIVD